MNRKLIFSGVLMLILPLFALIQGVLSPDRNYKRWVIIIFITIYGSIIMLNPGSDGFVHQSNANGYYSQLTFFQFFSDLIDILTFTLNSNIKGDLYIHLLSYFVSSILGAPKLFFVFVSFVYAYFYTGSLLRIVHLTPDRKYRWLFWGFVSVLVLWKSIEGINTVRTWTGLWVLVYACLCYFQTKKVKYLFLMVVPPLIHLGWFAMVLPALFVAIFGTWVKPYSILFILSFSFNILNPTAVTDQLEETEVGANKVKGYLVEEQLTTEQKIEQSSGRGATFYKTFAKAGLNIWAVSILALIIIFRGYFNSKMTYLESQLFSIGILTKVLSSSTWFLFALSNRSAIVSGIFILAAFVLMAQRGLFNDSEGNFKRFEKYSFTTIFLFLTPFLFLRISEIFDFLSIFLLSSPFIVWFFNDVNISMKDGIRMLFSL